MFIGVYPNRFMHIVTHNLGVLATIANKLINEKLLEDLEVMGFPKAQATRALHYYAYL
ncbi:UBA-like [Vigna unguiculata]|uniref:UBA-like n=1 Tax=Vigna unguiculata TaxID=3917 RepID=A0A4D6N8U7_VIGUN|nr:UBA-like [Vigna unguiculata]